MNKFEKSYGGREKLVPMKTKKSAQVGDCVFRAIAHATGIPYKQVWNDLLELSKETLNLPNSEETYGRYLISKGWYKKRPKRDRRNKTIEVCKFPAEKQRSYIIHTRTHLTAIVKGIHKDSWNCGRYRANSYYTSSKYNVKA
jgi:hypothetical protein